ncbi:AraC family transcriptional regulator [Arenibaculum sp.]|uniref:helix-turn-helix transcriptional regulator n=1 Tax=Arenibaculum sp. TaxID=2865862 RepID=UPI002E0D6846|nr:AraC family transcriptional regulator [Arenibaculum sp.]
MPLLGYRHSNPRRVELVDRLIFEELVHELPVIGAGPRRRGALAQSVASFIDTNLDSSLDLNELAERFSISRRHLTRLFRSEYGVSIGTYIADRRVDKAKDLLRSGEAVSTAAYEVGFESPSHFARTFRQIVGFSPKEYRHRPQGGR